MASWSSSTRAVADNHGLRPASGEGLRVPQTLSRELFYHTDWKLPYSTAWVPQRGAPCESGAHSQAAEERR
jgi:hypothetical protein